MNILQINKLSEDQCRAYLEGIRWPDGPVCPHCREKERVKALNGKATRPGVFKCYACRKQFTVTTGTVLHGTHLPIKTWINAFYLVCSSKKGISALQLQRQLGIGTYKSAWHLCHRIRLALDEQPLRGRLRGDVEVDETYVGGKPRERRRKKAFRKRENWSTKVPVFTLVERGPEGRAVSFPVKSVTATTLKAEMRKRVSKTATIHSDEHLAYRGVGKYFRGGHKTVYHTVGEYYRHEDQASTNTVESYFSLLKRGVNGVFHHVSKHHLHRYCHEFAFRWTRRKKTDWDRTCDALRLAEGKRLAYGMAH